MEVSQTMLNVGACVLGRGDRLPAGKHQFSLSLYQEFMHMTMCANTGARMQE